MYNCRRESSNNTRKKMQIIGFSCCHDNSKLLWMIHPNSLFKRQTNDAMAELEEMENRDQVNEKVKKFMLDGCGCALGDQGGPCSRQFSEGAVLFNLNNCQELSSDELDLVILANSFTLPS